MSNSEEVIKVLKERNEKLTQLLSDPQPGLHTWWEWVYEQALQIAIAAGVPIE